MNVKNTDPEKAPFKALVFGTQAKLLKQMADQLIENKLEVKAVMDERLLVKQITDFDPDLIFMEINGVTSRPITEIVRVVFAWINNHARNMNKTLDSPSGRLWHKARVIMFKNDIDSENFNPSAPMIEDLDDVLLKCQEQGDIVYIGLYAAWSFEEKINPLLKMLKTHEK